MLAPGTRLGLYEILSPIGKGGMGEVYRARDTKLERDVAIKVLPEEFAKDKERLARFEREARLLASVNHPYIATLHGLEDADGIRFLVMELLEGETLAQRIARGPIPIDEALPLFLRIAEGLGAAHEKSVIHRDLKPANINIGPDGNPKILDFGLAKGECVQDAKSESPTVARQETETGVILGTPAYMSPEQARGKTLDKRTDIWSFGCCLYEALTGKTVFHGETVSDTIGKILEREPDWEALPEGAPRWLRSLLRRCLEKDPGRRLHDVADARLEIEEALETPRTDTDETVVGPAASDLATTRFDYHHRSDLACHRGAHRLESAPSGTGTARPRALCPHGAAERAGERRGRLKDLGDLARWPARGLHHRHAAPALRARPGSARRHPAGRDRGRPQPVLLDAMEPGSGLKAKGS